MLLRQKVSLVLSFGFVALAATVFGYEWPAGTTTSTAVTFGSVGAPIASGTVEVPTAGAQARSIGIAAVSQDVVVGFEGGALEMGDSASVSIDRGTADFDVPVSAPSTLTVAGSDGRISFSGISLPRPETSTEPVTVFAGADLEEFVPVSCTTEGSNLGNGTWAAYNVRRGEGWVECQFQSYSAKYSITGTGLLKSIKVRFEQAGADVKARVVYGKYAFRDCQIALDTDDPSFDPSLHDDCYFYTSGYGVQGAVFDVVKIPVCIFRRPLAVPAMKVEFGAAAIVESGAATDGKFAADVQTTGEFVFRSSLPEVEFAGQMSGGGSSQKTSKIVFEASGEASDADRERTLVREGGANVFYPADWTLVFPDLKLSSITNVTDGHLGGSSIAWSGETTPGVCRFFRNDGTNASFFVEKKQSPYFKGVLVELRQTDMGVELRSPTCGYVENPPPEYTEETGYDFLTLGWGTSFTPAGSNYNVKRATFLFDTTKPGCAVRTIRVTGRTSGSNGSSDRLFYGSVEARCAGASHLILIATNKYFGSAAPCQYDFYDGTVFVTPNYGNGATLNCGAGVSFAFHPGSEYRPDVQTLSFSIPHVFDNAVLRLGTTFPGANRYDIGTDSQVYMNNGTLRNGARIAGAALRIGVGTPAASLTVDGTSPSSSDNNIILLSQTPTVPNTITFAVADVTADEQPDFLVGGGLKFWSSGYRLATVVKSGAGTMRFARAGDFTNRIEVTDGLLQYAASNAFPAGTLFTLAGGGLAFEANAANALATLDVTAAGGRIVLAPGASLSVAAAPALDEGRLAVTMADGATLRLGTGACLTKAQLDRIRANGHRVIQNADGTIEPVFGTMLIVR